MTIFIRRCFSGLAVLLLAGTGVVSAQHITLNQYTGQSEIKASGSVTLLPGFTIPAGSNVRIFISGGSLKDCSVPSVSNLSANLNYVQTRTFRVSTVNDGNLDAVRPTCEVMQTVQYIDGLGRVLQTVQVQGSPSYKDIIQPVSYDNFGRESVKYLPYAESGSNGTYRSNALTAQPSFYNNGAQNGVADIPNAAFAQSVFEPSPLNRVLEQGAPGLAWQIGGGHTQKNTYGTNGSAEVKLWRVSGNTASASSNYAVGTLYKTISTDENWNPNLPHENSVEEFKDKDNRVILKRTYETNTKSLDTYYVYDDAGNLRYVLPPAVNLNGQSAVSSFDENITNTAFTGFIYGYHYDSHRRLIEKHVPGKGWERLVYNQLDQVVLSQDSRQRTEGKWLYTKYDALERVVSTGIYTSGTSVNRNALQLSLDGESNLWESRASTTDYTNVSFPRNNFEEQLVNYYDDYGFPGGSTYAYTDGLVIPGTKKGLLTGTKVKVLGTSSVMLLSLNYYDKDGRVRQAFKQHYQGGISGVDRYDEVINSWSFVGELEGVERKHHNGTAITNISTHTDYDHMGRKLGTFETINGGPQVLLSKIGYNDIGQLNTKSLHGNSEATVFAHTSNYTYNERGWLKSNASTTGKFGFELYYNTGSGSFQYNGNISSQAWNTDGAAKSMTYVYDKLNRLTNAGGSGLGEQISYDVMGNISSLAREGFGTNNYINYSGNKLTQISGFVNSGYGYDENGNLNSDSGKGLGLSYNQFNLPAVVTQGGNTLTYIYDASGVKLRKVNGLIGASVATDYVDGIQYTGGVVDFIQTEEGLARNNQSGGYSYEYNLIDHLGNVRYSFNINPSTNALTRIQADDYYAFGLQKPVNGGTNKYLYNGKELQDGLGQYDYGARFYDPVIGRWNVVDPLAEKRHGMSAYNYVQNNPLARIDPTGALDDWYESKESGSIVWKDGDSEVAGYKHIAAAGVIRGANGEGDVKLNSDGSATNAQTGESVTASLSGKTNITAKGDFEPELGKTTKEIIDGTANGLGVVETGTSLIVRHSEDLSAKAISKYFNKVLGPIGKGLGLVSFGSDVVNIYNKGFENAGASDYVKLGLSFVQLVSTSTNPVAIGVGVAYGIADAAGYNPIDYIFDGKFKK